MTKKKKIIFSIDGFAQGGGQEVLKLIISELSKSDVSQTLIILQSTIKDIALPSVPYLENIELRAKNLFDLKYFFTFRKLLKLRKPDLIISSFFRSQIWSALCKPRSSKLIWVEQNTYTRRTKSQWMLMKLLSLRVNKIICVSKEVLELTKLRIRDKGELVPNPINFPLTFNLTQYRDIDFVFIGRMVEQKSPELTINSFANYLACFKPNETSCLHLIGDGELLEKMKELVIALNLEKSCFFHGELNIEETMIVLKRSKVLVSTSTIEGFGLARLEALANGCCVITTNTGGATQFLSNKSITPELVFGAFIVDSDVDEIANSMYISLQDEYWTNEAILGRRYLVNDLSAEKVAKLWIDV